MLCGWGSDRYFPFPSAADPLATEVMPQISENPLLYAFTLYLAGIMCREDTCISSHITAFVRCL